LYGTSAEVLLGNEATEARLKALPSLRQAQVLAFATHGLLPREVRGMAEPGLVFTPPAHASALDDGVLTASEAASLPLSAEWIILSACNTAAADGSSGAQSLSGLARAFLYAGAESLLASHWRVSDDATAALTTETLALHRREASTSRAQALQAAMREVRTGHRADGSALPGWKPAWAHPAAWAPFVLVSDRDR
jgi:CHAT domain-containing protein